MSERASDTLSNEMGKLILVSTPIGNMGDITLRALETLREAQAVYAEDTRVTGKLLRAFDIKPPCLERLDENTLAARVPDIISRIEAGEVVAMCTDAGMPGVSDPGLRLVAALRDEGLPVEVLPGASAATTAYVLSGTTCPHFYFGGFLPRHEAQRLELLEQLRTLDAALIFYESPHRLVTSLESIAKVFPDRNVSVCRELTKLHEEVVRGKSLEVATQFAERAAASSIKGEIAIVVDASADEEVANEHEKKIEKASEIASQMAHAGATQKEIVSALVSECGIPRNDAYQLALNFRSRL